ncbi:MAG: hypothetical protein GC159_10245 [Phycisphaera sp.]|nr:hypothetical protein [Phycisphaera sp.]
MSKTRYCLFIVAVTLVAAAVCVFAASPRFYLWRGLDLWEMGNLPEVNRAVSTQHQIDRPFAPVEHPSNAIIRWRLLFPLLANATSMPFSVYLALPFVGVLLLLGTVTHVVHRDTGDAWLAALSAGLAGTMSWFFVSTGWLTYFDSWYLLGALVVATARPMWAVAAAVLLCPWIDERFVLMLPLCLAVRAVQMGWVRSGFGRRARVETAWVVAAAAPYLLFRAIAMFAAQESTSHAYLYEAIFGNDSVLNYLDSAALGVWQGLRLAWGPAIFLIAVAVRSSGAWWWKPAIGIGITAPLLVMIVLAGDYSRSTSVMLPVVIAGIVLAGRLKLPRRRSVLAALLLLNLLLPVAHVVGPRISRIKWLPAAWHTYRNPEGTLLDPALHLRLGNEAMQAGRSDVALFEYSFAIDLHPEDPSAFLNRATAQASVSNWQEVVNDTSAALTHAPIDWPLAEPARLLQQRAIAEIEKQKSAASAAPKTSERPSATRPPR